MSEYPPSIQFKHHITVPPCGRVIDSRKGVYTALHVKYEKIKYIKCIYHSADRATRETVNTSRSDHHNSVSGKCNVVVCVLLLADTR